MPWARRSDLGFMRSPWSGMMPSSANDIKYTVRRSAFALVNEALRVVPPAARIALQSKRSNTKNCAGIERCR